MFITFYGVNNIGKTTHAKRFVRRCEQAGLKTFYLKYPIYGLEPTGPFLNEQLRGEMGQTVSEEELQQIFYQNRLDYEDELKQLLEQYDVVVAEDYTQTGIAWGTAKGASEEWLEELNAPLVKESLSVLMVGERAKSAAEVGHVHESSDQLIAKCAEVLMRRADKFGWLKVQVQPQKAQTEELVWETISPHLNLA